MCTSLSTLGIIYVSRWFKLKTSVQLKLINVFVYLQKYQVPYLDLWSDVEEDYSSCLTGATSALHNASLRLPIVGGVRVSDFFSHYGHNFHQYVNDADPILSYKTA
jgi:hypothetical protein